MAINCTKMWENFSRFFDWTFAIGFATLSVLWLIVVCLANKKEYGFSRWIVFAYYIFFTLFMAAVALKQKHIYHYCGFLKGILSKTIFYWL